jgi:hypothetical protein
MKTRFTLALLVVLALGLRFLGVGWGVPYRLHPDAGKYIKPAAYCSVGVFNPHYFENPSGMTYPLWLWLTAVNAIETSIGAVEPRANLKDRYEYEAWLLELWGRWFVALLGAASVVVMFQLARNVLEVRGALIAALLFAVCFVHVRQSRYAVNDVPMLLVFLGATLMTVCLWARGRWRDLIWASFLSGYATGTKYAAFVAVLAIFPALFWPREPNRDGAPQARPLRAAGWVAAFSAAGFFVACPYAILDCPAFCEALRGLWGSRIHRWEGQSGSPVVVLVIQSLVYGVGLGPLLLILVALCHEQKIRKIALRHLAPLWGGPLSFLLLVVQPLYFARFSLPLLPYLALLAGWAAERLLRDTRTDTRVLAVKYLRERLRPGENVAADDIAFPFRYREVKVAPAEIPYASLGLDLSRIDPARLATAGFQWFAVSSYAAHLFGEAHRAETLPWRERLYAVGKLAQVLSAGPMVPFHIEHSHTPFVGLFGTERPGPHIYLFRLDAEKARALLAQP